jgi:DNA-binding XRE family transcriptional regulator
MPLTILLSTLYRNTLVRYTPAVKGTYEEQLRQAQTLGERIRVRRRILGLKQTPFGLKLGVSQPTVSEWERDAVAPSIDHLQDIAALFKCDLNELIKGRNKSYDKLQSDLTRQTGVLQLTGNNTRATVVLKEPHPSPDLMPEAPIAGSDTAASPRALEDVVLDASHALEALAMHASRWSQWMLRRIEAERVREQNPMGRTGTSGGPRSLPPHGGSTKGKRRGEGR